MIYTVGSLIEMLDNFPKELEILTELSLLWNFPDEIRCKRDEMSKYEYEKLTQNEANELLIFEGSWDKDNISDVNNLLDKYLNIVDKK